MPSVPPVTWALIVANTVIYILQLGASDGLIQYFALWPLGASPALGPDAVGAFQPWQLVTYSFLHGSFMHLFLNMLALFMFGSELERLFGRRRYLAYYFAAVLAAALTQIVVSTATGSYYPTVGASGGVFGLLLAYGIYFPRRTIVLLFPPIPMPAWLFVIVYAVVELYLGVTGTQAGVAHFAHLGGMVGGFLMLRYWRRRSLLRR
ncbi:MAG TPA: rhomboid family intramembrane serine protease [Burkholderiales bacterium]|nr:rhomboid family intramembrane serine protease [Burkholderiales bacterium]